MYIPLTTENMKLFFPSWLKPLSDKEINDFLKSEPLVNENYEQHEHAKRMIKNGWPKVQQKRYTTKKEIRQDIKIIEDKMDPWITRRDNPENEMDKAYALLCLEDLVRQKENLKAKLKYTGVKFGNDNLERAKHVPISDFLLFNSAGMAKCPFHKEHTPSFHKLPGNKRGHCFGCGRTADLIDVVMEQNNCDLPAALKIILR